MLLCSFVIRTFFKFIYVMMRGEYYIPPPKPADEKSKHIRKPLMASKAAVAEMLPDDSLQSPAAVDAFGFGLSVVKKEVPEKVTPSSDESQYVFSFKLLLKQCDCFWHAARCEIVMHEHLSDSEPSNK